MVEDDARMQVAPTLGAGVLNRRDATEQEADAALLRRIAAEDRRAVAELYARHQRPLFRYLWQLTSDHGLAEEILQDTIVAVWQGAPAFQGRSAVRTWLFAIARRQAHNVLRRRGLLLAGEDDLHTLEDSDPGPEEHALRLSDAEDVQRALARLPLIHREVLVLNFVNALRYDEIATVLGVPQGTVKSRLNHAKRGLRRLLHDEHVAGDASADSVLEGEQR
jgi:RNA polymerase sigma factor (sigma-70 family)